MFNYNDAFSRNIGWLTESEQEFIRSRKVAIAGLGGVGSEHLVTLSRLGIAHFNISDFDDYEVHNFNRQAGAYMSTIGRGKCQVMAETAKDINPESSVSSFPNGIDESNVDAFLDGVDIYVDSLDFFALDARKLIFRKCEEKKIPIVTAAPIGMGTAILCFTPNSMSFTEYFDFKDTDSENDGYIKFLIGLTPAMLQKNYLVDPSTADFLEKKGPSTAMGVKLCAGAAATFALKILLNRGDVPVAPHGFHFDAYNNKLKKTWRPFGNRNPIQRLAFKIVESVVLKKKPVKPPKYISNTPIKKVIDRAKWAPSGDNTQVWRFELTSDKSCIVHGFDTRDWVVYDLQGNASKLALGCLLENMDLAAKRSGFNLKYDITECSDNDTTAENAVGKYTLSCQLIESDEQIEKVDELLEAHIGLRTTQRRAMGSKPLSERELHQFNQSLPEGFELIWKSKPAEKWQIATLLFGNAYTRLSMKEGFDVHSKIIEFTPRSKDSSQTQDANNELSRDKIPGKALGLGSLMQKMTEYSFGSWKLFDFASRYLGATLLPRMLLDLIPAYKSAGIFALVKRGPSKETADYIEAGRAVQRVWLMSSALKLGFQPCQTPVIFSEYLRNNICFTNNKATNDNAAKMEEKYQQIFGSENTPHIVFMGRVGQTKLPQYRSVRLATEELIIKPNTGNDEQA